MYICMYYIHMYIYSMISLVYDNIGNVYMKKHTHTHIHLPRNINNELNNYSPTNKLDFPLHATY